MAYTVGKARQNLGLEQPQHGPERISFLQKQAEAAEQTAQSAGNLRFSDVRKGVTETIFKQPARFLRSAVEAPETIIRGGEIPTVTRKLTGAVPGIRSQETFQDATRRRISEGQSPLIAGLKSSGEAALAGIETLGLAKGGSRLFSATKTALKERSVAKAFQEALEVIRPKLSAKQQSSAFAQGRGSQTRFTGKINVGPSPRDIEVASATSNLGLKRGDDFKNITKLKNEIAKVSETEVRASLKSNDAIFNNNQLRSRLGEAKEGSRVLFGSDKTQETAYDTVIDEFVSQMGGKKNKISDLYEARIAFDKFMKSKFGPDILDPTRAADKVRSNAILDIRKAANEYISELLPEGNKFKDALKRESLYFEAIKNISNKAPRIGSTRASRFFERNPKTKEALKYGAGVTAGGALGGTVVGKFLQ